MKESRPCVVRSQAGRPPGFSRRSRGRRRSDCCRGWANPSSPTRAPLSSAARLSWSRALAALPCRRSGPAALLLGSPSVGPAIRRHRVGALPLSPRVRAHGVPRGAPRGPIGRTSVRRARGDRRGDQSPPRHGRPERQALRSGGPRGHGLCRRASAMARRRRVAMGVVVLCGRHRHSASAPVRRPGAALSSGRRHRRETPAVPRQSGGP